MIQRNNKFNTSSMENVNERKEKKQRDCYKKGIIIDDRNQGR